MDAGCQSESGIFAVSFCGFVVHVGFVAHGYTGKAEEGEQCTLWLPWQPTLMKVFTYDQVISLTSISHVDWVDCQRHGGSHIWSQVFPDLFLAFYATRVG